MNKFLILLLSTTICTSCMKKLSESDSDGPEATPQEVQSKILAAWGDVEPESIRKGEFVAVDREQQIQDGTPVLVQQDGVTVKDRTETPSQITFTFLQQTKEINGDQSKQSTVESVVSIKNPGAIEAAGLGSSALSAHSLEYLKSFATTGGEAPAGTPIRQAALSQDLMASTLGLCVKSEKWDVVCHNLSLTEEVRPAPTAIQSKPNCGGIPQCQIHVRKVTFDLILRTTDENNVTIKQKIRYNLVMSPDVPYLSRMMDLCYRGLVMVPSAGQKVLVGVCNSVKSFEPGVNN